MVFRPLIFLNPLSKSVRLFGNEMVTTESQARNAQYPTSQAGTAAAYMQVHKAGKSFGAESLLPVQVNQILSSFPYDKVPGEFSKIVVYHKNAMNNAGFMEKIVTVVESFSVAGDKSLEHLKSVAEMNPDNAEMAAALPEINELLQALKSKRKKALMIAGAVLVFTILLAAIAR